MFVCGERPQTSCRAACAAGAAGRGFEGRPQSASARNGETRAPRAGLRGFEARASGITVGKLRYRV